MPIKRALEPQPTDTTERATEPGRQPPGRDQPLPKARNKRDERHWRGRAALIQERLGRARKDVGGLQARLADLQVVLDSEAALARKRVTGGELAQATRDLIDFQQRLTYVEQEWDAFAKRAELEKVPTS